MKPLTTVVLHSATIVSLTRCYRRLTNFTRYSEHTNSRIAVLLAPYVEGRTSPSVQRHIIDSMEILQLLRRMRVHLGVTSSESLLSSTPVSPPSVKIVSCTPDRRASATSSRSSMTDQAARSIHNCLVGIIAWSTAKFTSRREASSNMNRFQCL